MPYDFRVDLQIADEAATPTSLKGSKTGSVRDIKIRPETPVFDKLKDGLMISAAKRAVILIVEDDILIRMDAAQMVAGGEFDVIEAATADEAIVILETRSDIAVIFTDIQMPGSMDGLKLAAAVRDRWPPIKIIATSGHVTIDSDNLPDGGRFLPKPYSSAQILKTLRELTV